MKKRICAYFEDHENCLIEEGKVCTIGESWGSCAYGQIKEDTE